MSPSDVSEVAGDTMRTATTRPRKDVIGPVAQAGAPEAAFSAAIWASIFFRAARIISSLRFCNALCLSARLELQPAGLSPVEGAPSCPILPARLYRVIRSGSAGLAGVFCAGVGGAAAGDRGGDGGWNVAGG